MLTPHNHSRIKSLFIKIIPLRFTHKVQPKRNTVLFSWARFVPLAISPWKEHFRSNIERGRRSGGTGSAGRKEKGKREGERGKRRHYSSAPAEMCVIKKGDDNVARMAKRLFEMNLRDEKLSPVCFGPINAVFSNLFRFLAKAPLVPARRDMSPFFVCSSLILFFVSCIFSWIKVGGLCYGAKYRFLPSLKKFGLG